MLSFWIILCTLISLEFEVNFDSAFYIYFYKNGVHWLKKTFECLIILRNILILISYMISSGVKITFLSAVIAFRMVIELYLATELL